MFTSLQVVQLLIIGSVIGRHPAVAYVVRRNATQRIADIKCKEYSEVAESARIYCYPDDWETMSFPHQATLGYSTKENDFKFQVACGGSLISDRFVLTAGHCILTVGMPPPNVVRLGAVDNDDAVSNCETDFAIERRIKHPKYSTRSSYHDIALVKLNETVEFTYNYRPACLWTSMDMSFTSVFATGFGAMEHAGKSSSVLNMVELDILKPEVCKKHVNDNHRLKNGITNEQLCIGKQGKGDTCHGDSGGPVQVIRQTRGCLSDIIGVTSVGTACGLEQSAAIYTRVASYIDWIEQEVWNKTGQV